MILTEESVSSLDVLRRPMFVFTASFIVDLNIATPFWCTHKSPSYAFLSTLVLARGYSDTNVIGLNK